MATQASRLYQVHPWRAERTAAPGRPAGGSAPRLAGALAGGRARGLVREALGGLVVLGTWAALWTWFLAATW